MVSVSLPTGKGRSSSKGGQGLKLVSKNYLVKIENRK